MLARWRAGAGENCVSWNEWRRGSFQCPSATEAGGTCLVGQIPA